MNVFGDVSRDQSDNQKLPETSKRTSTAGADKRDQGVIKAPSKKLRNDRNRLEKQ